MTVEMFLQVVFQIATAVTFMAWAVAGTVVAVFYAYKVSVGMIKNQKVYAKRLRKARLFSLYSGELNKQAKAVKVK